MNNRFTFPGMVFSVICMVFLAACAATQTAATVTLIPTNTAAPTAIPHTAIPFTPLAEGTIIFTKPDERKFVGTIHGQGETAIILANMADGGEGQWDPFVRAVDKEKFTLLTFLRLGTDDASIAEETELILQQFRNNGYQRVICLGASMGVRTCGSIADEPEMIGIVLVAGQYTVTPLDQITYPKLFISGAADAAAKDTQRMYDEASEPKKLVLFEKEGMHGTQMFYSTHSEEFLKQLLDFVDGLD